MINTRTYKAGAFILCLLTGVFTIFPIQAGISLVAYSLPIVIYYLLPKVRAPGEKRFASSLIGYSLCGAAIYLALFFITGVLLKEIARSPYDLSPRGILINLGNILPLLVLREVSREYTLGVIKRYGRWRRTAIVILILYMILSGINYGRLSRITEPEALFISVVVDILPSITLHILLTLLVYYGGAGAGLCYQGLVEIFLHVFPLLPDLPWIAKSALGIAFPVFMAIIVKEMYAGLKRKSKGVETKDTTFYAGVLLAVGFCWFCVGVFPVYPSIILTGSMEPDIRPGDVVLITKVKEEKDIYQLAVGDVINFDQNGINITHRIIEVIYDEAGNISFQTKGDNNQSPDQEPVNPNSINGIVENTVPKVGIPLLILKARSEVPEGVVDNAESTLEKK